MASAVTPQPSTYLHFPRHFSALGPSAEQFLLGEGLIIVQGVFLGLDRVTLMAV